MRSIMQNAVGPGDKPIIAPGHRFGGTSDGTRHAFGCLMESEANLGQGYSVTLDPYSALLR
jgi:hypothetical protein